MSRSQLFAFNPRFSAFSPVSISAFGFEKRIVEPGGIAERAETVVEFDLVNPVEGDRQPIGEIVPEDEPRLEFVFRLRLASRFVGSPNNGSDEPGRRLFLLVLGVEGGIKKLAFSDRRTRFSNRKLA